MNRTKIEWCDFTFNPVTGCWGPGGTAAKPNWCPYCYARKIADRFYDRDKPEPFYGRLDVFNPTFHPERLSEPARVKKPSKIFVCSMADLFGDWVPWEWQEKIIRTAARCPQHIFQFLTKNPKVLRQFNPWPKNCWVGTTVTNQADADERLPWLLQVEAPVRFVSVEPMLGAVNIPHFLGDNFSSVFGGFEPGLDWGIIGAMTGPGAIKPKPEWIQGLLDQYRAAGVPVFLKDNLKWIEKVQEWPTAQEKK